MKVKPLNISFATSHCSLGYLGLFQLLQLGFLIGIRMPEGEKKKREDKGVIRGERCGLKRQNMDFFTAGRGRSFPASKQELARDEGKWKGGS